MKFCLESIKNVCIFIMVIKVAVACVSEIMHEILQIMTWKLILGQL